MSLSPAPPEDSAGGAGDSDIAAVGALVADRARCRVLLALGDGRALPASRLAAEAGVSPATASSHLHKLLDAGLLTVEARGRHRYYRLAGPHVGRLIEALQQVAPAQPVRSLRAGTRAGALRRARTCYDHIAGRLGVDLMAALLADGRLCASEVQASDVPTTPGDGPVGWGSDVDYSLTASGLSFLDDFGVVLPPNRPAVRYCVDWSEQRHHLAGALGRGLLDRLDGLGWVTRSRADRSLQVTAAGRTGLRQTFGVDA